MYGAPGIAIKQTNFEWSNKPFHISRRHVYGGPLNNDYIIVTFRDNYELTILREQFENFDQIRNHLYNYCVKNKIIYVKPRAARRKYFYR